MGRCLQCGQCAQICPYNSITLRASFNPLTAGTPQVVPRRIPCRLCMRCPPVCPSGALAELEMEQVRMGRAQIDRNACYTWRGNIICRSCYETCPLKATAIVLEKALLPVITEYCAGCGVCEYVCPARCITTTPQRML